MSSLRRRWLTPGIGRPSLKSDAIGERVRRALSASGICRSCGIRSPPGSGPVRWREFEAVAQEVESVVGGADRFRITVRCGLAVDEVSMIHEG